jgi:hypothetical protein
LAALALATDDDSDGYLEYGSDEYKKVTGAPAGIQLQVGLRERDLH